MSRVCAYIDGFNLYHGLKQRKWRQFYWIDPYKLIEALLAPGHSLGSVKYFTARVRGPKDKVNRQSAFLEAIRETSQAEIILGKFYRRPKRCKDCGSEWTSHEEKMTDSAIASHLVADAFRDQFDTAFLVGGDTDIVPAVKMVRRWFPKKQLFVWFSPARQNQEVETACHDSGTINGNHLGTSLMENSITTSNGFVIEKPTLWA